MNINREKNLMTYGLASILLLASFLMTVPSGESQGNDTSIPVDTIEELYAEFNNPGIASNNETSEEAGRDGIPPAWESFSLNGQAADEGQIQMGGGLDMTNNINPIGGEQQEQGENETAGGEHLNKWTLTDREDADYSTTETTGEEQQEEAVNMTNATGAGATGGEDVDHSYILGCHTCRSTGAGATGGEDDEQQQEQDEEDTEDEGEEQQEQDDGEAAD